MMVNKNLFFEKEIPYQKLEKLGIDRKSFLSMPKEVISPLLHGQVTPLLQADIKTANGTVVHLPMKLQLLHGKDGQVHLLTYPVRKQIANTAKLNDHDMERLKAGQVIKKDVEENGKIHKKFIQLDKETNSLMIRSIAKVKMQEKLRNIESVGDIQLGLNQKQAALEGKPIELTVGDQKVSVGVDLRQPDGFKVVQGDMDEWKRQQNFRYDEAHPEIMGYVQTDKNRWEYKQVVDAQSSRLDISEKKEEKKSTGMKL